jgi:hypothetical protein
MPDRFHRPLALLTRSKPRLSRPARFEDRYPFVAFLIGALVFTGFLWALLYLIVEVPEIRP